MATVDLSIPVLATERTEREDTLYEIVGAEWADDDPRWVALVDAYSLICSTSEKRWPDERYQAACEAILVLVDHLPSGFNVDGCTTNQLEEFRICKRASDAIAASLESVMTGVDARSPEVVR
jgi:hypothetical protein